MKRKEYATLNAPAIVANVGSVIASPVAPPTTIDSSKNISFERKPFSSGTPAIADAATVASDAVIGIECTGPQSHFVSRVPVSCCRVQAAMDSEALKVA